MSLYYAYLIVFLVGGTLMLGQLLLSLVGVGHDHGGDSHDFHGDHDLNHDHDHGHDHDQDNEHDHHHQSTPSAASWFLGWLTVRTLTAAAIFFGLAGLAAEGQGLDWLWALAVAIAAGFGALVLVGTLMKSLHKLKSEGTVRIAHAVGQPATVYLTIPAGKSGAGKVTVVVQNRTMEYRAVTPNHELPTGTKVKVTAVIGSDTVEVVNA